MLARLFLFASLQGYLALEISSLNRENSLRNAGERFPMGHQPFENNVGNQAPSASQSSHLAGLPQPLTSFHPETNGYLQSANSEPVARTRINLAEKEPSEAQNAHDSSELSKPKVIAAQDHAGVGEQNTEKVATEYQHQLHEKSRFLSHTPNKHVYGTDKLVLWTGFF